MSQSFLYVLVLAVNEDDQAQLSKCKASGSVPLNIRTFDPVREAAAPLRKLSVSAVNCGQSEEVHRKQELQFLKFPFPIGTTMDSVKEKMRNGALADLLSNCRHSEVLSFAVEGA
jgi:hypothetical protein